MEEQFYFSVARDLEEILAELLQTFPLTQRHILVIGTSTSEVLGKRIGTNGSDQVAQKLFDVLERASQKDGFHLAFQCCEHLNRALVVTSQTKELFALEQVMALPVPQAGGAMAAYAYAHLPDAVLVESVEADAGIDIGDTLIGMHLKRVAVPVRTKRTTIGHAHVTVAKTRPKLIGGARAVYSL